MDLKHKTAMTPGDRGLRSLSHASGWWGHEDVEHREGEEPPPAGTVSMRTEAPVVGAPPVATGV